MPDDGQTGADPQVLHTQLLAKIDPAAQQHPRAAVRAVLAVHEPMGPRCSHCIELNDHDAWDYVRYPCVTVRAIASALGVET